MKKFLFFIAAAVLLTFMGCSNDSGPTDSGGLGGGPGGGGGGTGNVTIEVQLGQDEQTQGFVFVGKPSANITLTSLRVEQANQQIDQTFEGDPNTVYNSGEWYNLVDVPAEYLQQGQVWKFTFNGTIVQGNQTFNKEVSYTIQ